MRFFLNFIVLSIALLLQACTWGNEPYSGNVSHQAVELLPAESSLILFANLKAIKNSQFTQEYRKFVEEKWHGEKDKEELDEFLEKTGIDPDKDVTGLYLALDLSKNEKTAQANDKIAFVLTGDFDTDKIISHLEETLRQDDSHWEKTTISGKVMFRKQNDREIAFLILNDETLLAGTPEWLMQVASGERPGREYAGELLQDLRYRNHFWLIVNKDMQNFMPDMKGTPFGKRLAPLGMARLFVLSAQVGDKLRFEGFLQFDEEQNSTLFAEIIRGGLAAMRLGLMDNQQALDALNAISVESMGKKTIVRGEFSSEILALTDEQSEKI